MFLADIQIQDIFNSGCRMRLPAPPSVGNACLPVGRGPVGRDGGIEILKFYFELYGYHSEFRIPNLGTRGEEK
jgi:hypothetical protein